jgi:integrase
MKGHVRERPKGSGNWYAVIDIRDPSSGKRKRKWHSLDVQGKRDAQIECARLISEMKGGIYLEPNKTTLAQFLDRWLEHIRPQVSPRTHERYSEIAKKNLYPALGAVVLTKLQPMQISEAYTKALSCGRRDGKGGLSPSTVRYLHVILKASMKQAVRWQMLARNPVDAVDPPKIERNAMSTYDLAQTADLIDVTRGTRMTITVILAVLCGLRRGEIAALRWRNINLSAGQLAITESAEQTRAGVRYKQPKSGRGRTVALSVRVVDELRRHRVQQAQELLKLGIPLTDDTFVVAQSDGCPLQPRTITHQWHLLLSKNKALPRIRFHDLRHAHATHMLSSGVHPKIASERLGHSKVGITMDLYSHVMPGMQEDAAARVDRDLEDVINRRTKTMGSKRVATGLFLDQPKN